MKRNVKQLLVSAAAMTLLCAGAAAADQYMTAGVTATSTLPGGTYETANLQDYNPATAWVEGVSGDGIGETLTYAFPAGTVLTGGTICPGYHKSEDLLGKNGAPSALQISTGNQTIMLDLKDAMGSYYGNGGGYDFWFYEPLVSDGAVTVSIESVRKGWKYEDTCISELRFFGTAASGNAGAVSGQNQVAQNPYTQQTQQNGQSQTGELPLEQLPTYLDGLAGWIAQQQTGYNEVYSMTVPAEDLTAQQQAAALYWYQYHLCDERIIQGEDGYNTVNSQLLSIIAEELFGDALQPDTMTIFYDQYTEFVEGDTVYMNGTGDFGDAGYYYFAEPDEVLYENGMTCVTGRVMVWNQYAQSYIHEYVYKAWYTANEPSYEFAPQTYCFERVEII